MLLILGSVLGSVEAFRPRLSRESSDNDCLMFIKSASVRGSGIRSLQM